MSDKTSRRTVVQAGYPELAALCWNRNPNMPITGEEALALYERNWVHVVKENLSEMESELIWELADTYGNGVLLVR